MSPEAGFLPTMAFTSAFVGAELSLATRVTTKVAEPFKPFEPFAPLVPFVPLLPLKAIARIG